MIALIWLLIVLGLAFCWYLGLKDGDDGLTVFGGVFTVIFGITLLVTSLVIPLSNARGYSK